MPYILLVEDDADLAEVTGGVLRDRGFEVGFARNGMAALHSLARRPADLVLLDLMLPVMTGTEMLAELRRVPRLQHTPVIVITAMRELLPEYPDVNVLMKPFSIETLVQLISRLVSAPPPCVNTVEGAERVAGDSSQDHDS